MISSKWIAIIVQGLLVFLATQPHLFTGKHYMNDADDNDTNNNNNKVSNSIRAVSAKQ